MKAFSEPGIFLFGENSLLLQWEEKPNAEFLKYLLSVKKQLSNSYKAELSHTYNEILVQFHGLTNFKRHSQEILSTIKELEVPENLQSRIHHLPVCYDEDFAWDLQQVCERKNLTRSELIGIHSEADYLLYFIGFLPGFLYLEGLDERLFIDRKQQPRKRIPKGAVGLAGSQTGIYPKASPAGWQIIGNCPIPLFDAGKKPPSNFAAGDVIRFFPVDTEEYRNIKAECEQGIYRLKSSEYEH